MVTYEMFKVLNQEFTFDVDLFKLPSGLNGAVYFSETQADGGMASNSTNKAGAKYEAGYHGSQWPRELKFIAAKCSIAWLRANSDGWTGTYPNSGVGNYGFCCNEMDVWADNSIATTYPPHPCDPVGPYKCTDDECGWPSRYSGICDPDGCDFNPYRQGAYGFYGPGKTIDTTQKFTIVTQFIIDNGTATGSPKEIRRLYSRTVLSSPTPGKKTELSDHTSFQNHGGLKGMGESLKRGGVLVLSIWDDYAVNILWLNSYFPADCTGYGCERGTCPANSGVPSEIQVSAASATVTYFNIRVGDIGPSSTPGSTTTTGTTTTRSSSSTTTTSTTTFRSAATTSTTTTMMELLRLAGDNDFPRRGW